MECSQGRDRAFPAPRTIRDMIFVDTNVFMYAVGRAHPLKQKARAFFEDAVQGKLPRLYTSAEVVQELLHAYLPVERLATFDRALVLIQGTIAEVWPVDPEDVALARDLVTSLPSLGARDLLHLACCPRKEVSRIKTFDRNLAHAFS